MAPKRDKNLEARCRRIMLAVGWELPFFLMPAAMVRYREEAVGTMKVDWDGLITIDPEFAGALSDKQLAWCLCHELMHLLMLHHSRSAGFTDKERINRAQDMSINQTLRLMLQDMATPPEEVPGAYYPPVPHRDKSSDQLYGLIPERRGQQVPANPMPGQGCGVQQPSPGAKEGENGEPGASGSTTGPSDEQFRKWEEVAHRAKALAAGTRAGDALAGLLTVPEPKVRWEQVLRSAVARAISSHGRDEQTWTKRARRQPPGIILPGWHAVRAQVAVAIDSSGSMSDEQLAQCVAEVVKIAKVAEGVAIFLVVHDAAVQWEGWLRGGVGPERVQATLRGRGGTCFEPAYEAVGKARGRFDALVHLTDGECFGRWPERPRNARRLVAALLGEYGQPRPAGALTVKVG